MKELADKVMDIEDELASCVSIQKCEPRGKIYTINKKHLDENSKSVLQECKQFISNKLSTEMRYSDDDQVLYSCKDVAGFAVNILNSTIDDKIKIALFSDLNIFGYMFDRHQNNYRKCADCLNGFLDHIEDFKQNISPLDLIIWNNSIYGGEDQIPFFRGYLLGIMDSQ